MTTTIEGSDVDVNSSALVVEGHRGRVEVVDQLADEWRVLCAEAVDDQPFFRPEWIRAYLRAFVPKARLLIVTVRHAGRLLLLLPLIDETATFNKIPVRRLRAPVNSCCGRFDAVRSAAPHGNAAISAAWQYLKGLAGWDILQFRDALDGSTVDHLVDQARADGFRTMQISDKPNPYVPIPKDDALLKQMPPNAKLRSQLRQARKRLDAEGALKFYRLTAAEPGALERFYQLEASGWKGRIGSCALKDGSRQFYDEVAASAAHFGYFSLHMLELDNQLLASHFSFIYRGRCYSPKVAYNENFGRFAPGHLIVDEIVRDCAAHGIYGFDITGQDQPWKMKWTSQTRSIHHYFIFKGTLGKLAYAARIGMKSLTGRLLPERRKSQ
jgi:CelD/BcsL family acetyltransferase involved in cellulose biosynthesis